MVSPLPIDEVMPQVLAALLRALERPVPALVLAAPPGAGKTTRVPWALAQEFGQLGQILVTEPRRVAARLSAHRVADERQVQLGREVGYRVRFDEKAGPNTKIVYLTEGALLERLARDPELSGVGAVLFDEVHERSALLDLTLSLSTVAAVSRANGKKPLALLAMSATLDVEKMAAFWQGAETIVSEGRAFPVEITYADGPDERPLPVQVRSAVRQARAADPDGDVLVFLPGAAEIRATAEALSALQDVRVVTLHGDLPLEEQARVVADGGSGGPRVVLSTNIAETSLTIPRVTTVIDSGLARVARFDPWTGVNRLVTVEVSQARAVQRSGRAGRVRPGRAQRLYTVGNYRQRPTADSPELVTANLGETRLTLLGLGLLPESLPWLDAPTPLAWKAAEDELTSLGAMSEAGEATEVGRRMAQLSAPPRVARLLVAASDLGVSEWGAMAAALLTERDPCLLSRDGQSARRESGPSDLLDRLERLTEAEARGLDARALRDLDLARPGVDPLLRARDQYLRQVRGSKSAPASDPALALSRALLAAFPDRVALRRGQSRECVLATGISADLDRSSVVTEGGLYLALAWDAPRSAGLTRGRPVIRMAHAIPADLILDALGQRVEARDEFRYDAERDRVEAKSGFYLGVLALDESVARARPGPQVADVLVKVLEAKGPAVFDPEARLEALRGRLRVACEQAADGLLQFSPDVRSVIEQMRTDPKSVARQALSAAASGATSIAEVQKVDLTESLLASLPYEVISFLDDYCPVTVTLRGGKKLPVHYEDGRSPWIESRLQDFFSMQSTPTICRGRVPLTLQLLGPNFRPLQVTTDLAGFWDRHYPALRKELMRRYPKHLWPEDGATATPPTPGKIR